VGPAGCRGGAGGSETGLMVLSPATALPYSISITRARPAIVWGYGNLVSRGEAVFVDESAGAFAGLDVGRWSLGLAGKAPQSERLGPPRARSARARRSPENRHL
jgi:hypothetical protein